MSKKRPFLHCYPCSMLAECNNFTHEVYIIRYFFFATALSFRCPQSIFPDSVTMHGTMHRVHKIWQLFNLFLLWEGVCLHMLCNWPQVPTYYIWGPRSYFLESFLWEWRPIVQYTDILQMYGIECMMSFNLCRGWVKKSTHMFLSLEAIS